MRELVFAYFASRPEFGNAARCRKSLIGPMRRYLARHDGAGFSDWDGLPTDAAMKAMALIAERKDAAETLADFCRRCGRCPENRILRQDP
jgi:hypothetical protein